MVVLRLGDVHLLVIVITGEDGARAEVAGAALAELLPDELLVDEGGALELREHQPRHEQQLHRVPDGDPVQHRLRHHLQQRDEGVDDPVRQPLLVVHLGRALHRAHRRVQRVQQGDAWPAKNGTTNASDGLRRQEDQKSTEETIGTARWSVPGDGVEVGDERPRLAHFASDSASAETSSGPETN
jgi:hypothetical protein